jgi:hypothetical protein
LPPPIATQVGTDEFLLDDSREYAQLPHRTAAALLSIFSRGMHYVFQRDVGSLETADFALDLAAQFVTDHWT